jgi:carboxylesterase type B
MDMGAVVTTSQGKLRGSVVDGVYAFLGVPYAATPFCGIGTELLQWWRAELQGDYFGPSRHRDRNGRRVAS